MKKFLFFLSFMACIFIFAQKKITKKYRYGENAENAKVFFKKFQDGIIAQKFDINYRDDLSSNSIDVDYTTSDKNGSTKVEVRYTFNNSDFTIHLLGVIYTFKSTGVRGILDGDSVVPEYREYYESLRSIFVTQQANYISPDIK